MKLCLPERQHSARGSVESGLGAQGVHYLPLSSSNIRLGLGCHTGRLCQVCPGTLKSIQFAVQRLPQYELKQEREILCNIKTPEWN